MAINNDQEFKAALKALTLPQQRQVGGLFVERVNGLNSDVRVRAAIATARRGDVSDAELVALYHGTNSARVESFTQCGHECDWRSQAGHFVARAALACVRPADAGGNLAWDAAMDARMACTFDQVASGQGTETREAEAQYRILEAFLQPQGIWP